MFVRNCYVSHCYNISDLAQGSLKSDAPSHRIHLLTNANWEWNEDIFYSNAKILLMCMFTRVLKPSSISVFFFFFPSSYF